MKRNCFCCDKPLYSAFDNTLEHKYSHPPFDAMVFRSNGNYGSTIFDPMSNERIEIFICDQCVYKGQKNAVSTKALPQCNDVHIAPANLPKPRR
jgi:hypothetical protein